MNYSYKPTYFKALVKVPPTHVSGSLDLKPDVKYTATITDTKAVCSQVPSFAKIDYQ